MGFFSFALHAAKFKDRIFSQPHEYQIIRNMKFNSFPVKLRIRCGTGCKFHNVCESNKKVLLKININMNFFLKVMLAISLFRNSESLRVVQMVYLVTGWLYTIEIAQNNAEVYSVAFGQSVKTLSG